MAVDGLPEVAIDRRVVRRALHEAGRGDATAVHAIVESLLADGWSAGDVVTGCLAEVAHESGRRWHDGRWTVVQEHAATAVIDAELALLAQTLPAPSLDIDVMVVCVEGEWHVTPARMAALLLREHGFHVRLVGGSVPADQLDRTLAEHPPDVLAVSCTYPLSLAGAARIAAVARRRGIPTLAGGAGFGTGPNRARRLGLDGWAGSVRQGADQLLRWHAGPTPGRDRNGPEVDLGALEDRWSVMADEVLRGLRAAEDAIAIRQQPVAPLRRDLVDLLKAAHLTALCEDPTLFTDHLDRLASSPAHGGLPAAAIPSTLRILRELVGVYEPGDTDAGARIDEAVRAWAPATAADDPVPGQAAMIARALNEVADPDRLSQRLVSLAAEVVPGCDHVVVVMLEHGERVVAVTSAQPTRLLEQLERELGEGPCTDAIERREPIESGDLSTEPRWPSFAPLAVERTSARAVLALPLIVRGQLLGVLELIADAVAGFAPHDRLVAEGLATHAAIALHAAIQQRTLVEAIRTRDVIGQAKGILMEREGVDDEGAFELLRALSSRTNTKLRDVAEGIVRRE